MVYKFEYDLCDADYVEYTARHQRSNKHKYSAVGRHLEQHGLLKTDLVDKQFSVLKKRRSKFDCLIFDMLLYKKLNPKFNTQIEYSRQTPYVTLRSNISSSVITTNFYFSFVSPRNSFTFIFVLILLIFDLMMTLSERRNVVAFLNF